MRQANSLTSVKTISENRILPEIPKSKPPIPLRRGPRVQAQPPALASLLPSAASQGMLALFLCFALLEIAFIS